MRMFCAKLQPRMNVSLPAVSRTIRMPVAIRLDVRHVGIRELRFAEVVFLVAFVDVRDRRGHAGPQAVDLDVAIAPVAADRLRAQCAPNPAPRGCVRSRHVPPHFTSNGLPSFIANRCCMSAKNGSYDVPANGMYHRPGVKPRT